MRRFRAKVVAFVLLILALAGAPAWANLQQEIDSMFDSMSNVTAPGSTMDQRRGLLSGGRYSLRSHVMNVQLLSVLPPSASMGCNGIDIFGGSFSFISKDQFIQLLRTIAANASGYAFKMAMQAMCPSCDAAMSNLQSIIQKLNKMSVDSCQAGKEIVTAAASLTPSVLGDMTGGASSGLARATGAVNGYLDSIFSSANDGKDALGELAKTSAGRAKLEEAQITGNVVWDALRDSQAGTWWGAGDKEFLEAIMSVTGSVIVRAPTGGQTEPSITFLPPILKLDDFMRGAGNNHSFIEVYNCTNNQCYNEHDAGRENGAGGAVTNPGKIEITLSNFTEKVGLTARNIVARFIENRELDPDQDAFMKVAPASIGAMLRNLAQTNRGMAMLYTEMATPTIARIMSGHLMLEMIRTATVAMGQSTSAKAAKMRERLLAVAADIRSESASIQKNMASVKDLVSTYKSMMDVTEKRRLGLDKLVFENRLGGAGANSSQ